MNKPDKNLKESQVVLKEGQSRFLSGDKRLSDCPSLSLKEIGAYSELGVILRRIHKRINTEDK